MPPSKDTNENPGVIAEGQDGLNLHEFDKELLAASESRTDELVARQKDVYQAYGSHESVATNERLEASSWEEVELMANGFYDQVKNDTETQVRADAEVLENHNASPDTMTDHVVLASKYEQKISDAHKTWIGSLQSLFGGAKPEVTPADSTHVAEQLNAVVDDTEETAPDTGHVTEQIAEELQMRKDDKKERVGVGPVIQATSPAPDFRGSIPVESVDHEDNDVEAELVDVVTPKPEEAKAQPADFINLDSKDFTSKTIEKEPLVTPAPKEKLQLEDLRQPTKLEQEVVSPQATASQPQTDQVIEKPIEKEEGPSLKQKITASISANLDALLTPGAKKKAEKLMKELRDLEEKTENASTSKEYEKNSAKLEVLREKYDKVTERITRSYNREIDVYSKKYMAAHETYTEWTKELENYKTIVATREKELMALQNNPAIARVRQRECDELRSKLEMAKADIVKYQARQLDLAVDLNKRYGFLVETKDKRDRYIQRGLNIPVTPAKMTVEQKPEIVEEQKPESKPEAQAESVVPNVEQETQTPEVEIEDVEQTPEIDEAYEKTFSGQIDKWNSLALKQKPRNMFTLDFTPADINDFNQMYSFQIKADKEIGKEAFEHYARFYIRRHHSQELKKKMIQNKFREIIINFKKQDA